MKFIDLTGQTFDNWVITNYLGESMWECTNTETGEVKAWHSYTLRTKFLKTKEVPKVITDKVDDLTNKKFWEWTVIEYEGDGRWKCKCSCGTERVIAGSMLAKGKTKHCTNPIHRVEDFTDKKFGEWTAKYYAGNMRWHCVCSCGVEKDVLIRQLRDGSTSCGHDRNHHNIYKDITGEQFGYLKVIGYAGSDNMWNCYCTNCGNIKAIARDSLRTGKTKSCGCLKESMRAKTLIEKYGDSNTTRINNPRSEWQITTSSSKENLQQYINGLDHQPTVSELSDVLGVNDSSITKMLKKFEMDYLIKEYDGVSDKETALLNYIKSVYNGNIICNDRKVLKGKEIDIYIPDKNIALEFDGNYWHSSLYKDKNYHQNKTLSCENLGIHLIHIFEYEWDNQETREKLCNYIKDLLSDEYIKVAARDTIVEPISSSDSREFLDKYHLQGNATASITIGMKYNDEVIGVMTFGKPRFNASYQYEMIRMCFKSGYKVIGGAEKMLKYFIDNLKPRSILSYCDLSKFNGKSYIRMGFSASGNDLTEPGYVWASTSKKNYYTRYETQKNKLIEAGFGEYGDTEDEIMDALGYLKIYNSGNMKFHWCNNTISGIVI